MILLCNVLALLVASLIPGDINSGSDPHGLRKLLTDPQLRELILSGNFGDYSASLTQALSERLAKDLPASSASAVKENLKAEGLSTILGLLQNAMKVATLASELQLLGPVKAMNTAVDWVESGLIRKSGLKNDSFPSFYKIISRPNRPKLDPREQRAVSSDFEKANEAADSAYSRLLHRLEEKTF